MYMYMALLPFTLKHSSSPYDPHSACHHRHHDCSYEAIQMFPANPDILKMGVLALLMMKMMVMMMMMMMMMMMSSLKK